MFPPLSSQRGVWQSIDLMLAFLILQTALIMALSPLSFESVYAHERAVNDMRLSSLLSLSHRIYTSAVVNTAPAAIVLDSVALSLNSTSPQTTLPAAWVGYFEPSSLSPSSLGLSDSHAPQLSALLSNSPLPPSTDRICVQRTMLYQNQPRILRLCSPVG